MDPKRKALFRSIETYKQILERIDDFVNDFDVEKGCARSLEGRLEIMANNLANFQQEQLRLFPLLKDEEVEDFQLVIENFVESSCDIKCYLLS